MDNIERAKREFEKSFGEKDFYDRQTKDVGHLAAILAAVEIKSGDRVLDFGTGSGYLAFAVAEKEPECVVVGLDVVSEALKQNRIFATEQGLGNLKFAEYGGMELPFADNTFDWVITRYVLHHVPDIQFTFDEISRVLKPGGRFFLADPTPNRCDSGGFVDSYMRLKNDGHNKFYTLDEFSRYAAAAKMQREKYFLTSVRFPRKIDETYVKLLNKTDVALKTAYEIEIIGGECFITEDVINITFKN